MNQHHNIHQWNAARTDEPKLFFHNYFISNSEFPGWYLKNEVSSPSDKARIKNYLWANNSNDQDIFKVDVIEGFSIAHAKNYFQEFLQQHMLPLTENAKETLGQNAYVDHNDEMRFGIFILANIVIRVQSVGKENIACNDFIKKIYNTLKEKPQEVVSQKDNTPQTSFRAEAGNLLLRGQSTSLHLSERAWYKFILDGPGEIYFHGDKLEYFSNEKSEISITLYTIKEHAITKDVIKLDVI